MMPKETGPELMVRPYQPAGSHSPGGDPRSPGGDRAALFQIGADTAFFGEPIEFYMEDRCIFLDSFYAYYTDYEPEHAWVACAGGQVVGFLTGCTDTHRQARILLRKLIPGVAWRLLQGYYHPGKKTWRYVRAIISAGLRREVPLANLELYPAHLHINLAAEWRGYGLGKRLMQAYLAQLKQLGVRGVHLGTTSMNEIACRMYERTGFHLLGARPTRMWAGLIDHPVENLCYGMEL
jgi:ribosomal protein S18 acetylase RimI-like enzyme